MKHISALYIISVCFILLFSSCGRGKKASNTQSEKTPATTSQTTAEKSEENPDKAHNSRNSLDFEGTYAGTLPCADCEGIRTKLNLEGNKYKLDIKYLGKKGSNPFRIEGRFSWHEEDNIITLDSKDKPNVFLVGENVLYCLDSNMERVRGSLADSYTLKRIE